MANPKFVTIDANGAQVNQELNAALPGYTANLTKPAQVLVLPIDAIADAASSTFIKAVPTTEGTTFRIIGIQIIKAGAAGGAADTVTVVNNGSALTGAASLTGLADKATSWLLVDDAAQVYTAGNPIGVTTAKTTNDPSCYVYIHMIKLT
jgi:hypothetical protein